MPITARIEDEFGMCLAELPDGRGCLNWLLALPHAADTACVRFIDPYGNTIFNGLQLPELLAEVEALTQSVTEAALAQSRTEYVAGSRNWPEQARADATTLAQSYSVAELRGHGEALARLIADAMGRGPHHYVKFVGD